MNHERTVTIGKDYQHFKGNRYRVLNVGKHSETLEPYVVYQALYGDFGIWVRPQEMFLSMKEVDGRWVQRFTEL